MNYSFKQQLPYIIGGSALTLIYQYHANGHLIWWQVVSCIPLVAISLWGFKKIAPIQEEFSIINVFKKYAHIMFIGACVSAYTFYKTNHYVSITNLVIVIVSMIMIFVIMERSLYE